jgi:hypothetical protein
MTRRPALPDRPLAHPAQTLAALIFGLLARLHDARGLHPRGAAWHATLRVPGGRCPGVPLLDEPGEHPAIVRLSNAAGVPVGWPDGIGLALRVPDAHGPGRHQDLLVTSTIGRPVLHHLPLPAPGGFARSTFSSLVAMRLGGERRLVGARAATPFASGPYADLDAVSAATAAGPVRFELCVAPLAGRFAPVAEIELGTPLSADAEEALDFDPGNTGGGIEQVPFLRTLRRAGYGASRARRPHAALPDSAG